MVALDVDQLLLSAGPDLPYLTGYEAMPLERLTMLVLPQRGDARLVVPRLEAPRVQAQGELFEILPWEETDDPIAQVARLVGDGARRIAIGDHTWARFLLDLQRALPAAAFVRASEVVAAVRMVKDADEVAALTRAALAVDVIAEEMRSAKFSGRTELDVHRELVDRMIAAGHERANFAIVAASDHAASPHHDASATRVIADAGYGEQFIHRVGHGIGTEAHEDPYMVAGNTLPLEAGHAFSVEPGIYFAGRFGMRLEDIVVATADGPLRLNEAPRDIAVVA